MEHGRITTVRWDQGIVYCDVQPVRYNATYQGVPVLKSHSGFIEVPKEGDVVMIEQLADGTRYIENVLTSKSVHQNPNPIPNNNELREGDITIRLDPTTQLTFSKTNSNKYDITIEASEDVTIKSGRDIDIESGRDINISAENEINVSAEQDVNVESKNNNIDLSASNDVVIQGIPFMEHVHSHTEETITDTSDGSGSTNTSTERTDTPEQQ